jgi:hypothetical protein
LSPILWAGRGVGTLANPVRVWVAVELALTAPVASQLERFDTQCCRTDSCNGVFQLHSIDPSIGYMGAHNLDVVQKQSFEGGDKPASARPQSQN